MGPSGLMGHMGLKKRERSKTEAIESVGQDGDSSACCESERGGFWLGRIIYREVAVFVIRGINLIKMVNVISFLSGSLVQSFFLFRINYILAPLRIETFHSAPFLKKCFNIILTSFKPFMLCITGHYIKHRFLVDYGDMLVYF